jgi:hypothetical protein
MQLLAISMSCSCWRHGEGGQAHVHARSSTRTSVWGHIRGMSTSCLSCAHECAAYRVMIKGGDGVSPGNGRPWKAGYAGRQGGQRVVLTGTVGGRGCRETLSPCGQTNLLEQTKCQFLLALVKHERLVAIKYTTISRARYVALCQQH